VKHRSIIVFTLLSIIVFTGLAVYGDFQELVGNVLALHPGFWLAALGLTLGHILIRLVRWEYYLRVLGVSADARTSTLVFLTGLNMIMVPGRVGELAKSYFLKQKLNTAVRLSAPVIIITERIGDVISVLLLGLWGLVFIPFGWTLIAITLAGIGAFLLLLASPRGVSLLVRVPLLRRWEPFFIGLRTRASHFIFSQGHDCWLAAGVPGLVHPGFRLLDSAGGSGHGRVSPHSGVYLLRHHPARLHHHATRRAGNY
jgi:hypothetical protein